MPYRFIAIFLLLTTPATASWRITSEQDRLTNAVTKSAWLSAAKNETGTTAELAMRCLNDDLVGGLYLEVLTSFQFTRGRVGLRYRIDDRPVQARYLPGRSDGYGVAFINRISEIRGAKRLRLELLPGNRAGMFYDFDVSGIDKIIRDMRCREAGSE